MNGALAAQLTAPFSPNDVNPLRIGGGATEVDGDFFFEGDVDEVAVYGAPLNDDRILAHYVAGSPLTTPPSITAQPKSQVGLPGWDRQVRCRRCGRSTIELPVEVQWTGPCARESKHTLTLTNITAANVGNYLVVVSNAGGSITSSNATLTIPSPPTNSYVQVVKADAPVAYWRLGESSGDTAKDEIGANDGAYLNSVTLGVPGAIATDTNTAVKFSSADGQKVDVPWSDVLNPPQFTVEVWARLTGDTATTARR